MLTIRAVYYEPRPVGYLGSKVLYGILFEPRMMKE